MGKNLGTIDASDHFIVLEGARCPNASGWGYGKERFLGQPYKPFLLHLIFSLFLTAVEVAW